MDLRARTVRVPGLDLDFDVVEGDTIIGPSIERGSWEEHESRLFRAHLVPGCTVVDLGANVGWFAVQAILAGAEVHAFEPVPAICEIARRNVARAMERGPGKGVVHMAAAGAEKGTAQIVLAASNHGDNRVVDGGAKPADMQDAEAITIDVVRVDDHVEGPARVLKIDTQGSEWLALQGAKKLLAKSPELALLMEFWPYALRGCEPKELLALLDEQGFTLGKATEAPYPMAPDRILAQALARDPVKGGLDLYGTRGLPFHVGGAKSRLKSLWRSIKEA
ncbi:MAG: FkbM family methyltransferase [Planctomycetota bacterium]